MVNNKINENKINYKKIIHNELKISRNELRLDVLYQNILLEKVFDGNPDPLAGMTSWSLAPEFSWWLFKYTRDTQPQNIIEFGSGISTLVIASSIKKNNASIKFVSVEHDYDYLLKTKDLVTDLNLDDYVELIYCPLKEFQINGISYKWYGISHEYMNQLLGGEFFNLILIDGPPASINKHSRFPVLPILNKYINDETVLILDDADRDDEKEILLEWKALRKNFSVKKINNIRHCPAIFSKELNSSMENGVIEEAKILDEDEINKIIKSSFDELLISYDELKLERDKLKSERDQLKTERNDLKKNVVKIKKEQKRVKGLHQKFRRRALFLSLPSLIVLSPILVPVIALRRYKRRKAVIANKIKDKPGNFDKLLTSPLLRMKKFKRVLVDANKLALAGDHERAIAVAESQLPAELAYTSNILRANAAIAAGKLSDWQANVNSYLSHFGVAPIRLEGEGSVFDRLSTGDLPPVLDGELISIIMPVWNAEKTVRNAALSILNQTWRNLELLIVDDCSTDVTWSILEEIAANDNRVKIFRNQVNVGPYVSKNIALTQAKGEWITGHDGDDWAHPQRIALQLEFCKSNGLKACISGMLRVAENGEFVRLNSIGGFVHDGACRSGLISLMISTQYFRDVLGGWDHVRTSGDSELLRRIEAIEKEPVPQLFSVTMFCLDNPDGLTNHPVLGYNETSGASEIRIAYRSSFQKWHSVIDITNAKISIFESKRSFEAPSEIMAKPADVATVLDGYRAGGLQLKKSLQVDVILVTDTCFSGGNASSSIDEIRWFKQQGLNYSVIHCPSDSHIGRQNSIRYADYRDNLYNWSEVQTIKCRVLICRHPTVVTAKTFKELLPKISAEHSFIVKNNSSFRPDGSDVYQMKELFEVAQKINTESVTFCPISPVMRKELEIHARKSGHNISVSKVDWTPTFDSSLYMHIPKQEMQSPYVIGRHGRDGAEKWLEDASLLLKAYPNDPDFKVSILGGANKAKKVIRKLPKNWTIHEFGSMEPYEYLSGLDVFVYFPNSFLVEAFGRTIVEAMLAGIPVILPQKFEVTFGNLPFYCEPHHVADLIRRLAQNNEARVAYLNEVQQIAVKRYSSNGISHRLVHAGIVESIDFETTTLELTSVSQDFRSKLMRTQESQHE